MIERRRVQITDAIESLKFRDWSLIGDPLTKEEFDVNFTNDGSSIITWEILDAEVSRLQEEYDNNQYQRDRAVAYPSLQDQADMAYWDRKNGTTTLDDAIAAVKAEFPKP